MEKTKRPTITHNATKVKALLFLQMRKQAGYEQTTAREIAIAINGNARSLYVLLGRWLGWSLVLRYEGLPFYTYCIDSEGERYLSKIDNWFFSGYYSKKRKKRVPGYRGKVETLKGEIALASRTIFWWRYPIRNDYHPSDHPSGSVYYIEAPFAKAEDFSKIEGSEGRAVTWPKSRLLVVKFDNAHRAYQFCQSWGFAQKTMAMGQAIVDARIGMIWAKAAQ